jgi:hypothetical protein
MTLSIKSSIKHLCINNEPTIWEPKHYHSVKEGLSQLVHLKELLVGGVRKIEVDDQGIHYHDEFNREVRGNRPDVYIEDRLQ